MLMVRLQRVGRKHEPVFRLVLTDSKNGPKSGKFLEILGNFDARRSEKAEFKIDRVKHWMENGAKLSDTVHNLLVERKVIDGKKVNVLPKKRPIVKEEAAAEVKAKEEVAPEAEKVAESVPEEEPKTEKIATTDEPKEATE
jgi:small subunit ribosomal protein S16